MAQALDLSVDDLLDMMEEAEAEAAAKRLSPIKRAPQEATA